MGHKLNILATAFIGLLAATPALAADGGMLEVTGVKSIHHLNVRDSGSLSGKVIGGVSNGAKLKNLGCTDGAEGQWCNVESDGGLKGWSFGKYLKGEKMAAAAMAPKAPPAFALGTLKCERNNGSPVADCSYGVLRIGSGARLQVTWPDASKRMFGIYKGAVTSIDGPVSATAAVDGSYDIKLTPKGAPSEHYVVAADVIGAPK